MLNAYLALAVAANLLVYGLAARWFAVPAIRRAPILPLVAALSLVHGLRTMGLTFWNPGVSDPALPSAFTDPVVIGDLIAAALGVLTALLVMSRSTRAVPVAWALTGWGALDLVSGLANGVAHHLADYRLGVTWFIPTFAVPAFLVAHALLAWLLVRRGTELRHALTDTPSNLAQPPIN